MNGILNILKPPGMTSQNVVSFVKRTVKEKKAGHTGTLDPGACGVLPVCIGNATRISEYLLNDKKSYRAEMMLGFKSDTLDKYGTLEKVDVPRLSENDIYNAFQSFKGSIEQLPPMYSAVKIEGRKLYELARQGKVVERKPKRINIYDINILKISLNTVLFDVTCSKGTYIRSLCSDIGKYLGSDAVMTFLLRSKTGPFDIRDSITLDELKEHAENESIDAVLYPAHFGLSDFSRVYIDDITAQKVKNGNGFYIDKVIKFEEMISNDLLLIFDPSSDFIATGIKDERGFIKINKVFS